MKTKFFVAAAAAVALIACAKNEESVVQPSVDETGVLKVRMNSGQTKITESGGDEEKSVSDYQILIYDMNSRMLEAYARPEADSDEISVNCRVGTKEVIVLANAPDVQDVFSYDEFMRERSDLADNGIGELVMEGHSTVELTIAGGTVDIDLKRMVAKIVLDGITVDFENDQYDEEDFILKEIYLTNVAGDMSYLADVADPDEWYNKIVRVPDDTVDPMIYESLNDINLKDNKEYTDKHHFYCYPNPYEDDPFTSDRWSPRPTRLVVEAMLDGVLYYYPVTLPKLNRNTKYHVTLHIARPGATSVEQDMDKYTASFNINIVEWQESDPVSETI